MLSQNQVDDIFKSKLQRPATEYEYGKYKTSSISQLATIDKQYGGLNTSNSVADLAQHMGYDPSLSGRSALAAKYGITGYTGSADQNKQLHGLLSGSTQPQATPIAPAAFSGTVPGATPPQPQPQPQPQQETQPQPAQPQPEANAGSIAQAAESFQPPAPDPVMADTLNQYQGVQKQISDIDNSVASALKNKLDEIAKNGGIVDETQVRSLVEQEQAPLMAKRRELVAQQGNLGKQYQTMLTDHRNSVNDYYKGIGLAQKGQQSQAAQELAKSKQADSNSRFAATEADKAAALGAKESNFAQTEKDKAASLAIQQQKADQSNFKISSVPVLDGYGNKVGTKIVRTQLMPDGSKKEVPLATDSHGALTHESIHTISSGSLSDPSTKSALSITTFSTPAYAKTFMGNADAPTDENQNVKVPGTTLTVGSLYQSALDWMANKQTSTGTRGSKTIIINTNAAIAEKGAAMLQKLGISKPAYEAAFKANSAALANNMKQYGLLSVNEKAATLNFKTLLTLSKKADAATISSASPVLESWIRTGQVATTGNADVNNFVSQLVLTMNEYAKVIAGQSTGGSVSDTARAETEKLLSKGMSADEIQSFYDNVASKDISNRVEASRGAIQDLVGGISSGTPGVEKKSATPTNVSAGSTITYQGKEYAVDADGNMSPL